MYRFALLALVLTTACAGRGPEAASPAVPSLAPIRLAAVGDSVMYLERTELFTLVERPGDTLRITGTHDAVIHVMRTAPDTLEAFYEHLVLRYRTPSEQRNVDPAPMIGPRFVLHEDDGRIEVVSAPPLPAEIRQLTDLRRQFDDFFFRVPRERMTPGMVWVDTVRFTGSEGEAQTARDVVTRFTVRGDTIVEELPALVIDYVAALESSMRSAPTADGTLTSTLSGEEEGWFVYSPDREVMLRRWRVGVLDGELVLQGNLRTHRFPQSFGYESRIELIPPVVPGSTRPAPVDPNPPAERI